MVTNNNRPKKVLSVICAILIFTIALCTSSVKAEAAVSGQAVLDYAKQFLGRPYVYGAQGPNSFDCSGLTSYAYRNAAGISIGRTTYNQINSGREVSRSELKNGDLVFTSDHHVGIYAGNGEMLHAPQTGDVVKISKISTFWRARRIIEYSENSTSSIDINSKEIMTICNTSFYGKRYPDLSKVFGTDAKSLYNHYINCGVKEGRIASETFDVAYYLNNNKDLLNGYGAGNYSAAYNHFKNFGYKENRDLSPVFNMKYYVEHNPDVKAAYGDDYFGIMKHFIECGMREGRVSSANFNLNNYKARYADLSNAFGNDNARYYDHYLINGIAEGRIAN